MKHETACIRLPQTGLLTGEKVVVPSIYEKSSIAVKKKVSQGKEKSSSQWLELNVVVIFSDESEQLLTTNSRRLVDRVLVRIVVSNQLLRFLIDILRDHVLCIPLNLLACHE